jgi:hypothetical protein
MIFMVALQTREDLMVVRLIMEDRLHHRLILLLRVGIVRIEPYLPKKDTMCTTVPATHGLVLYCAEAFS